MIPWLLLFERNPSTPSAWQESLRERERFYDFRTTSKYIELWGSTIEACPFGLDVLGLGLLGLASPKDRVNGQAIVRVPSTAHEE